jgi:hypothetical protein
MPKGGRFCQFCTWIKSPKRRLEIGTLYMQFRTETRCLPKGFRPGEKYDAIVRDEAQGIFTRYTHQGAWYDPPWI